MQWDHLACLLAVHRGGSVVAAAIELKVDRATVVRRLAALEDALDARLFHRTPSGCVLTEAGLRALPAAEEMERVASSLLSTVAGEDKRVDGPVRITAPEGFVCMFLAPKLPELCERHPSLEVHFIVGDRVLNLARREADIALRNARPKQQDLIVRRVGPFGFGLYATPTYLARHGTPTRRTWRRHTLVTYEKNQTYLPGVKWLLEHAHDARVAFRCNETMPVLSAARAGLGIALLPALMAENDPSLVRVPPGIIGETPELWLVAQAEVHALARIRVVYDFFVRALENHACFLRGGVTK